MAYITQTRRAAGVLNLVRDTLASAVTVGIARAFGEDV